jgi:hypothetical protein
MINGREEDREPGWEATEEDRDSEDIGEDMVST